VLVGRDRERLLIDALVAGARLGRSGVLVVTGEAGIGKTALLDYAAQVAGGVTLLRANGIEAEQDVPFGGLSQLLRPTPEELDRIPAPQAEALAVALALRPGPLADRFAVGAAVLSMLARAGEDRPLGVLIDDAHLLDRPSSEAIAFACRRLLADAAFVVVAARPDPPCVLTTAGLPQLRLDGLGRSDTGTLARARGMHPTPETVEQLHRVTGGNPLAVLELVRDAPRWSSLPPGTPVPVPEALIERYRRRTAALGDGVRTLLLLVAVAGGELPVVARAGAALGVGLEALADAERAGLVEVTSDRIDFVHPLVRAAVYADATSAERRDLHAAVAEAVPEGDDDRRAWHRCEATLGLDEAVAEAMETVAGRARARGAHATSATAYERAARLSADDGRRAQRLLRAADAAWRAGDGEWATRLVGPALMLDPSPVSRGRGLGLLGDIAGHGGSPAEARRLFVSAARSVEDVDPSRAVVLLAEAVNACYFQGDAGAALDAADRAQALLARPLTPAAAALGTLAVGMAKVLAGRPGTDQVRAGVRMLDAAVAGVPAGDRNPIRPAWLMLGPMWLRESGSGRALVRAALDVARARSVVGTLPPLLFTIARDGAATDHWARAEADYGEAIALARELGQTTILAMSLAGLAWLESRTGRTEDCRAHAAATLELCAEHPINTARVWAGFALGESALAAGDIAVAVERFTGLDDLLREIDLRDPDLSPAPDLAEALLRNGQPDKARAVAEIFEAGATAKGLPWALARAARVRALLCDVSEMDAAFDSAYALHAQTPDAFEEARTRLAHGARRRRSRRRAAARVPLRAALTTFERLGARPWADAAAAELEATGETVVRPGNGELDRLTARELQISLLLAEGRTTRETAAALFLSPKTVEYHLRHVYTKLQITSRSELVSRFGGR
jgi:DNA-binding CsgD family transcriptional regulator/tetratricopeptide (TPR) repeat protein